jgi:hypothetical protein
MIWIVFVVLVLAGKGVGADGARAGEVAEPPRKASAGFGRGESAPDEFGVSAPLVNREAVVAALEHLAAGGRGRDQRHAGVGRDDAALQ